MKQFFFRAGRIFTCAIALAVISGCAFRAQDAYSRENILRLHVIADSDSKEDQRQKLLVRDAVLDVMEPGKSAADAKDFLLNNGAALQRAAEGALRDCGSTDGVQMYLGRYDFPDRSYGDTLYPAGEYEALRIVIGEGAGQNWWCVLFPPLCLVTEEAEPLPKADEITFKSSLLDWIQSWREAS